MRVLHSSEKRRRGPARIHVPSGQVRVLESHHATDFAMEAAEWPFHKICWVAVGRGRLEYGGESGPGGGRGLRKDDFLLLPANWSHRFVDDPREPLTLVIICVSERYLSGNSNPQLAELWQTSLGDYAIGTPRCAKTAFYERGLVENFRTALREQSDRRAGWESALCKITDELLIKFARGHSETRDRHRVDSGHAIEAALEHIDTHLYEPQQIGDIAARCGLSPRRFTDLFKQRTGMTFSTYINEKRIAYACERLDESGHILYACHESGFNDLAYFYRVFKNSTGRTPGEYLKSRPAGNRPAESRS